MEFLRVTSQERLLQLLKQYDDSAPRRISQRVESLKAYAEKLFQYAENYGIYQGEEQAGFLSFYANDVQKKCAYLTLIAVEEAWRGQGIGSMGIQFLCRECQKRQMKKIGLEVDKTNQRAILFYQSKGFAVQREASKESIYMEKEISYVLLGKEGTRI